MSSGSESYQESSDRDYNSQTLLDYGGINIMLLSDTDSIHDAVKRLDSTQVGLNVTDDIQTNLYVDGNMIYTPSEVVSASYKSEQKSIEITGPPSMFREGRALCYIGGYVAECLGSIKRNRLLVHSAAVYSEEKDHSFVLLGEKGAGKTTLAIRLCAEYGLKLIGNDQVYIGLDSANQLVTGEGSTWIDVRETAVKADPYIEALACTLDSADKPAWNNKVRLYPDEINIGTWSEDSHIESIYNVRLDKHQKKLYAAIWTGIQQNLILHERIGRHITGQTTPFQTDNGEYLGSLPPVELDKSLLVRDRIVQAIIKKNVTELFGSNSKEVSQYIAKGE